MDGASKHVEAFFELGERDWRRLLDLRRRTLEHAGPWGTWSDAGAVMPRMAPDPLVTAFLDFWSSHDLVVTFDWPHWQEGRDWYRSAGDREYGALDVSTALKLLTVVIRADRFSEGTLVRAFESGDVPRILDRLVEIREARSGTA